MNIPELPYGELTPEQQAVVRMWYALGLKVEWLGNNSKWYTDDMIDGPSFKQEINRLLLGGELNGFTHRLAPGQDVQGTLDE